jgi:FMN phosphatase YigB (HAD superfamily)
MPDLVPHSNVLKRRRPSVVFVDWAGTMSHSMFWSRWRETAPARWQRVQRRLFGNPNLVRNWMRGRYTAEEIVEILATGDDLPFDGWAAELERSCCEMQLADANIRVLLPALRSIGVKVILATDNMDTFSRWTVPSLGLLELVDEILDSSRLGCLKDDRDPRGRSPFLHSWFDAHGIEPSESVLFDDGGRHAEELGITWVPVTPNRPLAPSLVALLELIRPDDHSGHERHSPAPVPVSIARLRCQVVGGRSSTLVWPHPHGPEESDTAAAHGALTNGGYAGFDVDTDERAQL